MKRIASFLLSIMALVCALRIFDWAYGKVSILGLVLRVFALCLVCVGYEHAKEAFHER